MADTKKNLSQQIGENIARAREFRGLSREELADRAGITRNGVYRIENGEVFPKPETIEKIAEVLKYPIQKLFAVEDGVAHTQEPEENEAKVLDRKELLKQIAALLQYTVTPGNHLRRDPDAHYALIMSGDEDDVVADWAFSTLRICELRGYEFVHNAELRAKTVERLRDLLLGDVAPAAERKWRELSSGSKKVHQLSKTTRK